MALSYEISAMQSSLYRKGIEFYLLARFSVLNELMSVCGGMFHNSIEWLLKGKLIEILTPKELKSPKMGHNLVVLWKAYKAMFPGIDLGMHDNAIATLDPFEKIRYPDLLVKQGGCISIASEGDRPVPLTKRIAGGKNFYSLSLDDQDLLVAKIVELNASELLGLILTLRGEAKRTFETKNAAIERFTFPE